MERDIRDNKNKKQLTLRGWMSFSTATNASKFIKYWGKFIRFHIEQNIPSFLVSVEHSMKPIQSGRDVQVIHSVCSLTCSMCDVKLTHLCVAAENNARPPLPNNKWDYT